MVALAEMAMASGIGAEITERPNDVPSHAWAFGEDQGRYLVTTTDEDIVLVAAKAVGIAAIVLGKTAGGQFTFCGETVAVADLRTIHESWLPDYMS